MTSAPVTASVKSFFTETQTAVTSTGRDVENSFSDVFNNQKSDVKTAEPEREAAAPARVDGRTDKVSKKNASLKSEDGAEVTPEEAVLYVEKAAEEMAAEMVTQAAEVLGISEEEVLGLLESMGMTTEDLLTTEGLQALVLAAAGENDVSSFMTDEQLFSDFRELQTSLEEAVTEVAQATGLEKKEVTDIFEKLSEQPEEPVAEEAEMTMEVKTAGKERKTDTAEKTVGEKPETTSEAMETADDGTEIMLERSLKGNEADNGSANRFAQESNPFAQTQTVQNMTETMANVQEVQTYFDADTEMIMNQITDYMRSNVSEGVSELEMQLHPESLGNLHVKLTAKEGMVTAQFTAQNEAVKNVLEGQMIQLKETFKEQGVTVENIEVEVQTNGFEHSLSQNGGQQTGSDEKQAGRPRNRRINLNDLEAAELTQEEQLAAEMLKESGNTVDYTV
ncbi:MAG: flagellar hook-length control protein FliK [Lachnospiraceae bacterium]